MEPWLDGIWLLQTIRVIVYRQLESWLTDLCTSQTVTA